MAIQENNMTTTTASSYENASSVPFKLDADSWGVTLVPDIKIHVHDEACFPVPDAANGFDLKVDIGNSAEPSIPPRMAFVLDLGWSAELPPGYRLEIQTDSTWVERGLLLQPAAYPHGAAFPDGAPQRMAVYAYNVGKQILAFKHGENIAKGWFVAVPQVALVKS